jgi:hypothetical protein
MTSRLLWRKDRRFVAWLGGRSVASANLRQTSTRAPSLAILPNSFFLPVVRNSYQPLAAPGSPARLGSVLVGQSDTGGPSAIPNTIHLIEVQYAQ